MSIGVVYRTCDVGIEGAHGCYRLQSYNEYGSDLKDRRSALGLCLVVVACASLCGHPSVNLEFY